ARAEREGSAKPGRGLLRERARGQADAATVADRGEQTLVQAIPSRSRRAVEATAVPEQREAAAVLCGAVDEVEERTLGSRGREAEVLTRAEGRVHRGERDLDEVECAVRCKVPRTKRMCDAGAEAGRRREAERGVV